MSDRRDSRRPELIAGSTRPTRRCVWRATPGGSRRSGNDRARLRVDRSDRIPARTSPRSSAASADSAPHRAAIERDERRSTPSPLEGEGWVRVPHQRLGVALTENGQRKVTVHRPLPCHCEERSDVATRSKSNPVRPWRCRDALFAPCPLPTRIDRGSLLRAPAHRPMADQRHAGML